MKYNPIGHSMGPPVTLNLGDSTMPIWGAFFTLEMGLLSIRYFTKVS
jgi:hypothetical protein